VATSSQIISLTIRYPVAHPVIFATPLAHVLRQPYGAEKNNLRIITTGSSLSDTKPTWYDG